MLDAYYILYYYIILYYVMLYYIFYIIYMKCRSVDKK